MNEEYLSFDSSFFVYGIGCDVFEIRRLEKFDEERLSLLAKKILHEDEYKEFLVISDKIRFLAVRFSVKESVAKSIKTGFRGFTMRDIKIVKTPLGAPEVLFSGKIKDIIVQKGIVKIEVSVSHDGGLVFTNAIALLK